MTDGSQIVRTLYKSITSCSDHHTDEIVRRLHIETPVDDAIVRGANEHKIVIVTGNPGRNPADHRLRMQSVERPKDGWKRSGTVR